MEAGDEVSQVLVQSLLHTARHVGDNATSELRAVLLFRLQGKLDEAGNFLDVDLSPQALNANAESLESNEAVLRDAVGLPEDAYDKLDDIVAHGCVHPLANLYELHLQQSAE